MVEVRPEETQVERMMWMSERITTLQNENRELKKALEEMEAKLALNDTTAKGVIERCAVMENAIAQIVDKVQRQNTFNESARASIVGLVEEVKTHQGNLRDVARVLQSHEQHIVRNGAASQEAVQYNNALAQENEKKTC